jgi:hypothetical protein
MANNYGLTFRFNDIIIKLIKLIKEEFTWKLMKTLILSL